MVEGCVNSWCGESGRRRESLPYFGDFEVAAQYYPLDSVSISTDIIVTRDVYAQGHTIKTIPQPPCFPERVVF